MTVMVQYFTDRTAPPATVLLDVSSDAITIKGNGMPGLIWQLSQIRIKEIPGAQKWIIENPSFTGQSLLIDDKDVFTELFAQSESLEAKYGHLFTLPANRVMKTILLIAIIVVGAILIFWKGIPLLVDFTAQQVPQEWVTDLSNEMMESVLSTEVVDKEKTALLRTFYYRLKPLKTEDGLPLPPIELTVIKKDDFNAFAIPGRKIVVFSGVFDAMKNYEELMALIGHEAGHVEGRHSMRTLFRSMSTYAIFSVFFGDMSGLAAVFVENASTLQNLSYSRDFEREADIQSHQFLCDNQSDPRGTVWLMEAMQKEHNDLKIEVPDFLSSHPMTEERIDNANEAIKENPCPDHKSNPELKRIFESLKSGSY